eukprot:c11686_g3_i1.p1 GENE.c11686_g3_i1~~c11686_g3_i1.p1  ORF type:complete len:484 (-),score=113.22 c11686_g3_i1:747-2198(-)
MPHQLVRVFFLLGLVCSSHLHPLDAHTNQTNTALDPGHGRAGDVVTAIDKFFQANPKVVDDLATCMAHVMTDAHGLSRCSVTADIASLASTLLTLASPVPAPHGSRPAPFAVSASSNVVEAAPFVLMGFLTTTVGWVAGKITTPRPHETAAEKIHRTFGSFHGFWEAVSKHSEQTQREMVTSMCLLADDYEPSILKPIFHPSSATTTPTDKTTEANTTNTVSTLTQSSEGDLVDDLDKHDAKEAANPDDASASLLEISGASEPRDPNVFIYGDSDEPNVEPDSNMVKLLGGNLESLGASNVFTPALDEESSIFAQDPPIVDPLEKRGFYCWERIREKVIQARDLRSWRILVKRATKLFGIMLVLGGMSFVVHAAAGWKSTTGCDHSRLTTDFESPNGDCMFNFDDVQVCKTTCHNALGSSGMYWCFFHDPADPTWVPIRQCPEQPTTALDQATNVQLAANSTTLDLPTDSPSSSSSSSSSLLS